jgi:putative FmdB family regulatory protein
MPNYLYTCGLCGTFEQVGKLDDSTCICPTCHQSAQRRPFSGIPYLKGDTVARSIPDPAYRAEAEKRNLNRTWGDASKSAELLRKNTHEDATGFKQVDLAAMRNS